MKIQVKVNPAQFRQIAAAFQEVKGGRRIQLMHYIPARGREGVAPSHIAVNFVGYRPSEIEMAQVEADILTNVAKVCPTVLSEPAPEVKDDSFHWMKKPLREKAAGKQLAKKLPQRIRALKFR